MNELFEVRPLARYDAPRYLAAWKPPPVIEERRYSLAETMMSLAMVTGMAFTFSGCGLARDAGDGIADFAHAVWSVASGDRYGTTDGDIAVACDPDDLFCSGPTTLAACETAYGGGYVEVECDERCQSELGPDASSAGCNAEAEDPCQCQYDVIDGGIAVECAEGELYCADAATLMVCDPSAGTYSAVDCNARCVEQGAASAGCDASAPDDACGCAPDEEP